MQQTPFYLQKIKEDFSRRQRGNGIYSLRAYGRDLGVHPSTLSQVLLGNRPLPLKHIQSVLGRLSLNAGERTLFVESATKKHITLDQINLSNSDKRVMLDETYHQIISEWEHYAVLTLFDCQDFCPSVESISQNLKISILRAEVVIENLVRFKLVTRDAQGQMRKSHSSVRTTEDVISHALRASHLESLDLAKKKLDEVPVELRDFSSITLAVDPTLLPQAKTIIREFRQKMAELLKAGSRSQVYQMSIQLYPITESVKLKKSTKRGAKNVK